MPCETQIAFRQIVSQREQEEPANEELEVLTVSRYVAILQSRQGKLDEMNQDGCTQCDKSFCHLLWLIYKKAVQKVLGKACRA
jgi:hypothetical protein